MDKLITLINGNKIIIQRAEYIEDGWYVVVSGTEIQLYEIPYGGGDPVFIGDYPTLIEAIRIGQSLT